MVLYIFGDGNGKFYQGRSPTGKVKMTSSYTEAAFFTESSKEDADDCVDLGLSLYSLEVSKPRLMHKGTGSSEQPEEDSFQKWEVHKMDLFGSK